ncbi:unnamed protein product [Allacma fusca]|uniref:Uncharacterized protein n=1 Tax=Allacma fusca TaxID=39272 RepID=A0A8J2KSW5_9HEXA|nr:unnamed protein product [Allacma fusca]
MRKFGVICILLGLASPALIGRSGAQLTPEEVPPELKYILESDTGDWEPPKELAEALPYYLSGFDSEGRPSKEDFEAECRVSRIRFGFRFP